jgi:hypothetical protein
MLIVTVIVIENSPMNPALPPLQTAKPADRSRMTGAFHPFSLKFNPSSAPLSPVPDPPMAPPAKSKFLSDRQNE